MKTRHGFVSNSSSSSFVVAFPHKPKNVTELQEMLFGDANTYPNPYHYEDDPRSQRNWPAAEIASIVFNDMKGQRGNKKRIREAMNGYFPGQPKLEQPKYDTGKKYEWGGIVYDYDAWDKDLQVFYEEEAERFMAKNPDAKIFTFRYADEDGRLGSAMEHGDLFHKLPHVRISRH